MKTVSKDVPTLKRQKEKKMYKKNMKLKRVLKENQSSSSSSSSGQSTHKQRGFRQETKSADRRG
jgi:hypothetical protein